MYGKEILRDELIAGELSRLDAGLGAIRGQNSLMRATRQERLAELRKAYGRDFKNHPVALAELHQFDTALGNAAASYDSLATRYATAYAQAGFVRDLNQWIGSSGNNWILNTTFSQYASTAYGENTAAIGRLSRAYNQIDPFVEQTVAAQKKYVALLEQYASDPSPDTFSNFFQSRDMQALARTYKPQYSRYTAVRRDYLDNNPVQESIGQIRWPGYAPFAADRSQTR